MRYKVRDSKVARFFAYTKARSKRLTRWLRLHSFPVLCVFLYQPINELRLSVALLRRIERLHQVGFHLHSLIVLPLEPKESTEKNADRKEQLPTVKKLLSKSTSATSKKHSPFQFSVLSISAIDRTWIAANSVCTDTRVRITNDIGGVRNAV